MYYYNLYILNICEIKVYNRYNRIKNKNIVLIMRLEFRLEILNVTYLTEKQIH